MCGRYSVASPGSAQDIAELFEAIARAEVKPRYNVAPSQDAPIVRLDRNAERELTGLRWGLVPFFAKDSKVGFANINARGETVDTNRAFREAFAHRRCLVVATGFYEWQKTGAKTKQPYNILVEGMPVFAMAGIWERWKPVTGDALHTFAIITTQAAPSIAQIHERMPVIVPRESWSSWLDPDASLERAKALLRPYASDQLHAYPVSTRVGSHVNDDPSLINPL